MIVSLCRLDDHVVNINLKVPPYLMGKDSVHESMVHGTNIFEAERHNIIVVVSIV